MDISENMRERKQSPHRNTTEHPSTPVPTSTWGDAEFVQEFAKPSATAFAGSCPNFEKKRHDIEGNSDSTETEGKKQTEVTKAGLAKYYRTGVRTIENWIADGLIIGTLKGRCLVFDVLECDSRLFQYACKPGVRFDSRSSNSRPAIETHVRITDSIQKTFMNNNKTKTYAKFGELASRYKVSTKTIKNWKATGILVFIKVRRVVRFDVEACDESLRRYGY